MLKESPAFTGLWISQILSSSGEWLSFIALMALVLELSGQGLAVGAVLFLQSIVSVVCAPFAGAVADKWDRRLIMAACDIVRMLAVASLIFLQAPHFLWLIFVVIAVSQVATCCFAPSAQAALPNIVGKDRVILANSLVSAAGGVIAALSAWLGGLVSAHIGRNFCFAADAATYAVSAAVILMIKVPFSEAPAAQETAEQGEGADEAGACPPDAEEAVPEAADVVQDSAAVPDAGKADEAAPGSGEKSSSLFREFINACRYAAKKRILAAVIALKAMAGLGGGVMVLLSVLPMKVFGAGDYGVGVLYGARGLGMLAGAVIAGQGKGGARPAAWGLFAGGLFCLLLGKSISLNMAAICVFAAFAGIGVLWVTASSVIQSETDDSFLGRVSALDNLFLTVTAALALPACGYACDHMDPLNVALCMGIILLALLGVWKVIFRKL